MKNGEVTGKGSLKRDSGLVWLAELIYCFNDGLYAFYHAADAYS